MEKNSKLINVGPTSTPESRVTIGGRNIRGGGAKVVKSINKEKGINVDRVQNL